MENEDYNYEDREFEDSDRQDAEYYYPRDLDAEADSRERARDVNSWLRNEW